MVDLWSIFCGASDCTDSSRKFCGANLVSAALSSTCINHALIISFDVLLLIVFLAIFFSRTSSKFPWMHAQTRAISGLQLISATFNGLLGLLYLCVGIWMLVRELRKTHGALPLHWWGKVFSQAPLRLLSILVFLFSGIACGFSLVTAILDKEVSFRMGLYILSLIGACLLLLCTYKGYKNEDSTENDLRAPLNGVASGKGQLDSVGCVTPFEKAGFISKMSFLWLNPLMKRGKEKTLEDEDIPNLREEDRAESCYLLFMDIYNKRKQVDRLAQPSVLKTILICHWREIFTSGFFAFLKIVTVSAGPLLLQAFIQVAEGKESFEYEGYVLAVLLFISKNLESLSQRQWYFRSRLVGVKVRSLLTAAIYKKQLRLSNTAKLMHSSGEIMNYVTVDAYRIGEFAFWFHQTWTTGLQLIFALLIVLKLYAWESHVKKVIENLRQVEEKWLSAVQLCKAYNSFLFWSTPVLVSATTFGACYFLGIPLYASNVFTFVATLRLVQDPIISIPDVIGVVIQAKVSFNRIVKFLEAPELDVANVRQLCLGENTSRNIIIRSASLSWEENSLKPSLRNINLEVRPGKKVAICGEVGSGKSTLLAAILGEVPVTCGTVRVHGTIAYVSQSAWIQTGSIRDNILFGSPMDYQRYQQTLEKCSLVKDFELLPHGDLTEIGERGVNLSGGQKQRIQLARALYQNADIYLLDDPFSAVDAHTATSLFNDYVMGALTGKTVLLVSHQVDFLPAFDCVLFMSDGEILNAAPYHQLLACSKEFQSLVDAHKETAGSERISEVTSSPSYKTPNKEIHKTYSDKGSKASAGDQLFKQEEREVGDTGFRPYIQYLNQNKGFLFFSLAAFSNLTFVIGQISQNSWMAANVDNPEVSTLKLIVVYLVIGFSSTFLLLSRSLSTVVLGLQSSKSLFFQLLNSLFRAPMAFYDSTPLGRILSRVSVDLSIVDLDVPFNLIFAVVATLNFYSSVVVLTVFTWQILVVSIPLVYLAIRLQRYYFASAKELMRINGTTKSFVANHLAESLAGCMTIRAFEQEERFFVKNLELLDTNASPFFHNFAANEWLIQRLETVSATVLASSALCMVLLPPGTFSSGFVGMALSYGLSLNMSLVYSIQNQCTLANYIISVERLNQYMHIPSEAPEVIECNRPPTNWPIVGKVEIQGLQIKYRSDGPLVLRGISCTFEGGHKIGIVGRTGSGKTTLIGALFRLVEPVGGRIVVDGIDICTIGLHDLRSRFGIIPQDPTLFNGTVRYNLDPLGQHPDPEIWEVLEKCQLKDAIQEKEEGLGSLVVEDGSNWSMGQRQLFCLGRALLRRSKILVLDEATASIDNATDMILQKTIRAEFADCTVITVAHRIPTVMDCTKVLAISEGKLAEYDEPMELMKREGSLFGKLVKEYWSHYRSAGLQ
ncbi:unnamed protein product [Coffea canephora]|uniref:ABC-type xenobiotic transporter n=1 Tax=Coffea canephora TaxID=49390 RepID=A0A068UC12_COFCA|nr:unnamed protein product [Coffea canephora]